LLCKPADQARMCELLFRETTTLGVRYRQEAREILQRELVNVTTAFGAIKIKVARHADGRVLNYAPEFEDCRAAAELHQVAVREVQTAAMLAFRAE
jgi:pyridinium-3,5-bisthiocarboxylic acid mononucleotide nickel chelatase